MITQTELRVYDALWTRFHDVRDDLEARHRKGQEPVEPGPLDLTIDDYMGLMAHEPVPVVGEEDKARALRLLSDLESGLLKIKPPFLAADRQGFATDAEDILDAIETIPFGEATEQALGVIRNDCELLGEQTDDWDHEALIGVISGEVSELRSAILTGVES